MEHSSAAMGHWGTGYPLAVCPVTGGGIEIQGPDPPRWRDDLVCGTPELGPRSYRNLYFGLQGGGAISVEAREMGPNPEVWAGIQLCHLLAEQAWVHPSPLALGLCDSDREGQGEAGRKILRGRPWPLGDDTQSPFPLLA